MKVRLLIGFWDIYGRRNLGFFYHVGLVFASFAIKYKMHFSLVSTLSAATAAEDDKVRNDRKQLRWQGIKHDRAANFPPLSSALQKNSMYQSRKQTGAGPNLYALRETKTRARPINSWQSSSLALRGESTDENVICQDHKDSVKKKQGKD